MLGFTSVLTPMTVNAGALSRGCRKMGKNEDCVSVDQRGAVGREKRFLSREVMVLRCWPEASCKRTRFLPPLTTSSLSPRPRPPAPLAPRPVELEKTRQSAGDEATWGPVPVSSAVYVLCPTLQALPLPRVHTDGGRRPERDPRGAGVRRVQGCEVKGTPAPSPPQPESPPSADGSLSGARPAGQRPRNPDAWEMRGAGTESESIMRSGRSWARSVQSGSRFGQPSAAFLGMQSGVSVCIKTSSVGGRIDQMWRARRQGRPLQWVGDGVPKLPVKGKRGTADSWAVPGWAGGAASGHSSRCQGPGAERRVRGRRASLGRTVASPAGLHGWTGPGAESRLCHLVVECKTLEKLLTF